MISAVIDLYSISGIVQKLPGILEKKRKSFHFFRHEFNGLHIQIMGGQRSECSALTEADHQRRAWIGMEETGKMSHQLGVDVHAGNKNGIH